MEDQHKTNLINFYEGSINKAKNLLLNKYSATQIYEGNDDFSNINNPEKYIFFKIRIKNVEFPLDLIISIPHHFPDQLPKIYLSKENYSAIGQIPHIDKNRFVCTKDPCIAHINDKNPDEGLDQLIRVAVEIINKGIKKESSNDFEEEFLAYWNEQAKYKFFSLFKPVSKIEILKVILSTENLKSNFKHNGLIAKSKNDLEKWINTLDIPFDQNNILDALYLPLYKVFTFPLPQKNYEIFKIIKESGEKNYNCLKDFLANGENPKRILFSFPIKNERILAGFKISIWQGEYIKGFRKGCIPTIDVRMGKSAMRNLERISIERVDHDRLFNRGGIGLKTYQKKSAIAIIGCGSLGSPLAISLSKCGISNFFLVDNDILEPGNVARHICGMSEAIENPYKSEALRKRILKHFPHIDCQASKENILDLLEKNETYLDKYDISIIAIGNISVERRLNYLVKKRVIKSNIIFIWIEPFGVAGHMFYLNPDNGGCFQCCFDSEGKFIYQVARNNKDFFRRESGCQSTYIPYSNLDIDGFINSVAREILFCLKKKPKQSYLMTWIGDILYINSLGYQINDKWVASLNYSTHRKEIKKNNYCELCQKK